MSTGFLFHFHARRQVAAELRAKGHGFLESLQLASNLDAETIDGVVAAQPEAVGAIGDGTILQKIKDFLNSPLGKMLISLLLALITGA